MVLMKMNEEDYNLTETRLELLSTLVEKERISLNYVLDNIYDRKKRAKDNLKVFAKKGWVEVDYGNFEITDEGRRRYQEEIEEEIDEKSLDKVN